MIKKIVFVLILVPSVSFAQGCYYGDKYYPDGTVLEGRQCKGGTWV